MPGVLSFRSEDFSSTTWSIPRGDGLGISGKSSQATVLVFHQVSDHGNMDGSKIVFSNSNAVIVPSSFLFLLVRHLLLEAMHLFLVASCSY